jgi:hypothetical protein
MLGLMKVMQHDAIAEHKELTGVDSAPNNHRHAHSRTDFDYRWLAHACLNPGCRFIRSIRLRFEA